MKIRANPAAPYSILNPETSSDSPSAKSNGVRLVSARQEITQSPIIGKYNKTLLTFKPDSIIHISLSLPSGKITNKIIKAKLISYEIV